MPAYDQLELIAPSGEIKFYDLDPSRGITNIGRHPENDIVIDSPSVAPFHAVLDHRQRPYQLVVVSQESPTSVGGEPVAPNVPHTLNTWDTIELNGHSLVLVEGGSGARSLPASPARTSAATQYAAAAPAVAIGAAAVAAGAAAMPAPTAASAAAAVVPAMPTTPGVYTRLATPPPDRVDETILTEITEREWIIDVEQMATTQLTIVNGGPLVATFFARVEGVDPNWVTMEPPQVNLFEGERATVSISITPPRRPDTSAGTRYVAFTVSSPDYPNHLSSLSGSLTVNPYYDFTITDIAPRQQTVGWRRPTGRVSYVVANRGNSECVYRVDGDDDERGCRFEFRVPGEAAALIGHAEMRLAPDASTAVPILVTPNKRRFFGVGKHNYMCTVTTTPLSGAQTPRAVLAQVAAAPLIGPWFIVLMLILLAVLVAIIFKPRVDYFGTDPQLTTRDPGAIQIQAGQTVTLYWRTWAPLGHLQIQSSIPQDTAAGAVDGATGSKTFKPIDSVTYDLQAQNFLTSLYAPLFSAHWSIPVEVAGVLPGISFTGTTTSGSINAQTRTITIVRGQSVTLLWTVVRTDELFLLTNDAPQTIAPDKYTGSLDVSPEADTTYKLQAHNHYTGAGGFISDPITVRVVEPSATPLPVPVIDRFDVQPLVITAGESVQLDWVVTGVDKVTITGVDGDLSPNGSIQVAPPGTGTVFFKLTATNGGAPVVLQRAITVNPAPTPSPVPLAPKIEFFTANPATVVADATTVAQVALAWSVTGHTTNIKISGPDFGEVNNLDPQGTITVSVSKPTLFVITALNGADLSASQTTQINVLPPTPTPTPPPTSTPAPTPLPLPIVIFSAASDPAHGDPPSNVQQNTSPAIPANTRQFTVTAGTFVNFSWTTTNAVKTIFNGIDKAPADSQVQQINQSVTIPFKAINAQNAELDLFIKLVTTPRSPPDPPFNVTGVMTSTAGPVTLSWSYNSAKLYQIDAFKIYRATLPGTNYTAIAINISKTVLPFQFIDTSGACNMTYYVVAQYTDTDGIQKETGPSPNNWNSSPCP